MIVAKEARDIQRSSNFEEKTMGLAVGSEAFVFNVLRKDLYSDPIGSLIREYTVNAQDEHRKHGKSDKPISIQVPNQFTPELRIRDYAGGLTEEQVFNFFGNYGASDKRDSNVAVGFFGLGCKSAFAYTDSYIVKSFKDGIEHTFNIYIDETEIGKTAKLSSIPTNKPNGVEIIVPVKVIDIGTFQKKVLSTIRYFKVTPTISGMEVPEFVKHTAVIKGEDWEFFGSGTPNLIMGEIAYPIDRYKLGELENWESVLINSGLNIHVNIGDVQVTASREALQMTPKTIATIKAKMVVIRDAMIAEVEKSFKEAKNLVEAKTIWYKVVGNSSGYANIIKNYTKGIMWKGEEIKDNFIRLDRTFGHKISTYTMYRDKISVSYSSDLACTGETIYFDDTDAKLVGYKRRARTLLNAGERRVVIIHTDDVKELEKELGISVKELSSLNAVVPTKAVSNRVGGTGIDASKRAKHASKVFVLNVAKLTQGHYSAASEVWDVKEVEDVDGIYIPIERFKPNGLNGIYDLNKLSVVIRAAQNAGIKFDTPIYGFKNGAVVDGLVKFDEWLKAEVESNTNLIDDYSKVLAFRNSNLHDVSKMEGENLPLRSVAKAYTTLYSKFREVSYDNSEKYKIFNYVNVPVKQNNSIQVLSKKFEAQYPMLKYVSSYSYNKPDILDYIQQMDKNN